jgi:hypothetical protein
LAEQTTRASIHDSLLALGSYFSSNLLQRK